MKKITLALALFVFGALAHADWALNNDESRLSFVSVKKGSIAEVHHFKALSGQVDGSGNVSVSIRLASVETAIPIRNERMQKMLFETEIFPSADLSANVDVAALASIQVGESVLQVVEATLKMHGQSSSFTAQLRVVRLDADSIMVVSNQPVIVNARDFALVEGVEKLREVAGLPSISLAVPVSFVMVFDA